MAINTGRVGGLPSEGPRPEKKSQTTPSSEVAKKALSSPPASPPQGGVKGLAKFWESQAGANKPTALPPRKLPPTPSRPAAVDKAVSQKSEPVRHEEMKAGPKPISAEDKEKLLKARESINSLRSKMADIKQEHAKPAEVSKAPTEATSQSKADLFRAKSQGFQAKAQQAKSHLESVKARHGELKEQLPKMQERMRPLPATPSSIPSTQAAKAPPMAEPIKAPAAPPLEQKAMEKAPASPKKSPQAAPDRGNLLADIQKGMQLKSSGDRPVAPVKSDSGDLRSHLALRRQHIEEDDEDDEGMSASPAPGASHKPAPAMPQSAHVKSSPSSMPSEAPPPPPPISSGAPKSAPASKGKDFLSEIRGKGVADLKKTDQPEQKKASKAQTDGTASFNKSMLEKAAELEKQSKSDLPESSDDEWND